MNTIIERPKVGVAVILIQNKKVLLGKRKNAHGAGDWAFPGGHLEFGESIETCATREVMEETGVSVKNIQKITYTNDIFEKEQKHYITCFVKAEYEGGEVKVLEPEKCEKWEWFEWKNLPTPLFVPIQNFLLENIDPTL